jgi:hypothetical protein
LNKKVKIFKDAAINILFHRGVFAVSKTEYTQAAGSEEPLKESRCPRPHVH